MKPVSIYVLITSIFLLTSCHTRYKYVENPMLQKNPTTFVYPFSLQRVRAAVDSALRPRYGGWLKNADVKTLVENEKILQKLENKNDYFLFIPLPLPSLVYRGVKEEILYHYELHIHIVQRSPTSTRVEINTINPTIQAGIKFPYNILNIKEPGVALEKSVPPTTIEEYKVLLGIGKVLGMTDSMPPLVLPDTTNSESK